jgi:hypothetical protein
MLLKAIGHFMYTLWKIKHKMPSESLGMKRITHNSSC